MSANQIFRDLRTIWRNNLTTCGCQPASLKSRLIGNGRQPRGSGQRPWLLAAPEGEPRLQENTNKGGNAGSWQSMLNHPVQTWSHSGHYQGCWWADWFRGVQGWFHISTTFSMLIAILLHSGDPVRGGGDCQHAQAQQERGQQLHSSFISSFFSKSVQYLHQYIDKRSRSSMQCAEIAHTSYYLHLALQNPYTYTKPFKKISQLFNIRILPCVKMHKVSHNYCLSVQIKQFWG